MANNVILGDLSLYRSDDAIKVDEISQNIQAPVSFDQLIINLYKYEVYNKWQYIFDNRSDGGSLWMSLSSTNTWSFNPSELEVFVNDVQVFNGGTVQIYGNQSTIKIVSVNGLIPVGKVGNNQSGTEPLNGYVSNMQVYQSGVIVGEYIKNGDFGSSVLTDHSGNGNDGTIEGATWWKERVDEVYATPALYKATLVSPLTEDQNVTYTDATPYYGADDVFWNPYNQDATYDFLVNQQLFNGLSQLGIFGIEAKLEMSF